MDLDWYCAACWELEQWFKPIELGGMIHLVFLCLSAAAVAWSACRRLARVEEDGRSQRAPRSAAQHAAVSATTIASMRVRNAAGRGTRSSNSPSGSPHPHKMIPTCVPCPRHNDNSAQASACGCRSFEAPPLGRERELWSQPLPQVSGGGEARTTKNSAASVPASGLFCSSGVVNGRPT